MDDAEITPCSGSEEADDNNIVIRRSHYVYISIRGTHASHTEPFVLDQKRVSISRSIEQRERDEERKRMGNGTEVGNGRASAIQERSTSQKAGYSV